MSDSALGAVPQGPQGPQGDTGPQGDAGPAYEPADGEILPVKLYATGPGVIFGRAPASSGAGPGEELGGGDLATIMGLGTAAQHNDSEYEDAGAVSTHAAASDPHTGYRKESEDHSHATTGAQGGTISHAVLTSVGVDDHHARDHHARHEPGGADAMAVDAAAATGSLRTLGTSSTSAAAGNDSRLSDARTPTAHASTHLPTGSDAVDKFSQSAVGTLDAAIANTETVVVAKTFAANELAAGQVYKFEAWFTKAGTQSAAATIRIRIGTTTLTGNIAATLTPPNNALTVPGKIEGLLRIVTAGSGGTARGELEQRVHLAAVTITAAINPSTGTVAVDTTAANQKMELTFISGHASNTYTFRDAVLYRVA